MDSKWKFSLLEKIKPIFLKVSKLCLIVSKYSSVYAQLDSISSKFTVDMNLYTDANMTQPMGVGHEGKVK